MRIEFEIPNDKLAQLEREFSQSPSIIRRAIAGAINETLREVRTRVSRGVRGKVNIKKRDIDKHLKIMQARSSDAAPSGRLTIEESQRLGLKYFGAKQTRRGVSYRIDKSGPRKTIPGAFGPPGTRWVGFGEEGRFERYGGIQRLGLQVFRRAGEKRLPLVGPMKGPSPWGVVVKAGLDKVAIADSQELLNKNLDERINLELLRRAGSVRSPRSRGAA